MKYKLNINKINEENFIYFNIFLKQEIYNIGTYTDYDDFVFPTDTITQSLSLKAKFDRIDNTTILNYVSPSHRVSFNSDSRINILLPYGYDTFNPSILMNEKSIVDYQGNSKTMADKFNNSVIIQSVTHYHYILDGEVINGGGIDYNLGFVAEEIFVNQEFNQGVFTFNTQGNNLTNMSLSPIIKEEQLMGISDVLETKNNIFIDRGRISAFESMLKLGDINNIEQLSMYGNGYFNIINE